MAVLDPSLAARLQPLAAFVLSRVAQHDPHATAIIDATTEQSLTYQQLTDKAHALAAELQRRGVKKNDVIAVMLPNDAMFPVLTLAANLAGITAALFNPLLTARELAPLLLNAKPRYIFTLPALCDTIEKACDGLDARPQAVLVRGQRGSSLSLDEMLSTRANFTPVQIDLHDTAFLCFSSGTTGKSKGVMLTHQNMATNILQILDADFAAAHQAGDVMDAILPFFHAYGLTVLLYLGLVLGNMLVLLPHFDLRKYLAMIQRYRVTLATVAPPVVLALSRDPLIQQYDISSIRLVMCGAAPLGASLQKECSTRLSVPVRQGFGMTEMAPVSHLCKVSDAEAGLGSVGTSVPYMEVRLVGPDGADVPQGEPGELWCRGPNVMKGYLNNPEATAECLSADGWLRTGDIAWVDKRGFYYIVDRVKELIKYKGYQVPPAELEAVLLQHPAVADAAVIGVPSLEAEELPRAYIVLKATTAAGQPPSEADIKAFVAQRVAPYKQLRGGVRFVDIIPKSGTGKILRRVLKANL
ncbi:4-coumarate--CoA ligase [Sorochytrium milnesiophthora]